MSSAQTELVQNMGEWRAQNQASRRAYKKNRARIADHEWLLELKSSQATYIASLALKSMRQWQGQNWANGVLKIERMEGHAMTPWMNDRLKIERSTGM
jgi:hypothetical protein